MPRGYVPYDARKADTPPVICIADDSERPVVARGMCLMHYKRFQKYGRLDGIETPYGRRPAAERLRRAKYARWERIQERNHTWSSSRDFYEDVGLPPSRSLCCLLPINQSKPIGPGNFRWGSRAELKTAKFDRSTREGRIAYLKFLAANDKDYHRRVNLKKFCGLSPAEYDAILKAQRGRCATCRRPEASLSAYGKVKRLAVDHDHRSGKIRGLLCSKCNRLIGLAGDNPDLLIEAAAYLKLRASRKANGSSALNVKLKTKECRT